MNVSPHSFPERMKVLVRRSGGTTELADAAGLSTSVIRKYLNGESDPSRERLVALARAAGVTVEWLATGVGPMEPTGTRHPEASPAGTAPDELPPVRIDAEIMQAAIEYIAKEERTHKVQFKTPEDKYKIICILYKMYFYSRELDRQPLNKAVLAEFNRLHQELDETWPRVATRR